MLGFGARDEHCRRDDEVHAPELLMAGDVLRGDAPCALGERGIVTGCFIRGEFAFGVRVEKSAIAVESEHQEKLRVHARGGNVVLREAVNGSGQGLS
jgi:hypothetical protein